MEILKLNPVFKEYLWGGTKLKTKYGKAYAGDCLAESWECSVHPDGLSIIGNGRYKGQTLLSVLQTHPQFYGTKRTRCEGLPILVKLIDAKQDLSIQVHPDDAYARMYEHQNGKSEMWYVVDADPDAFLIYGFAHPVTAQQLCEAIESKTLPKHLQKVPVHKGDVFYVPAGTVHGIGAGVLIAEVQESSNVTYRVYDYERTDQHGKKRELHFDKAVEVMNMNPSQDVFQKPRMIHYYPGYCREIICRCEYFETERIQISQSMLFFVSEQSFQIVLCLDGEIELCNQDMGVILRGGECAFLPADVGECTATGNATILKIRC